MDRKDNRKAMRNKKVRTAEAHPDTILFCNLQHALHAAVLRNQSLVVRVLAHVAQGPAAGLEKVGGPWVLPHAPKHRGNAALLANDFLQQRVVKRKRPQ